MREIRYTLLSDGSSDRALLHVLNWLLGEHTVNCAIQSEWADLRRLPTPPKTLAERIRYTLELYPCDLLCIHRDAERESREIRAAEIRRAIEGVFDAASVPYVCVVPVRMLEAWLLFDEGALRRASGNPNGKQPLGLPDISELEQLPDPKYSLHELLLESSGLHGRRRSRIRVAELAARVAELTSDFSPLRALPAFKSLEEEIMQVVQSGGWCVRPTTT
jgi:hypothetical protein